MSAAWLKRFAATAREGANECGRSDEEGDKEEEDDRKKEPPEACFSSSVIGAKRRAAVFVLGFVTTAAEATSSSSRVGLCLGGVVGPVGEALSRWPRAVAGGARHALRFSKAGGDIVYMDDVGKSR